MKKNFNKSGRFIRVVLGSALIIAALLDIFEDEFIDNLTLGIGAIILITALVNFCPLFYFLGINTSKKKSKMKMY